jgi:hypothetical protein
MRCFCLAVKNIFCSKNNYLTIRRDYVSNKKNKNTKGELNGLFFSDITKIILDYVEDKLLPLKSEIKLRKHMGNSIVSSCNFYGFTGMVLKNKLFIFSPFSPCISFQTANKYVFFEEKDKFFNEETIQRREKLLKRLI